MGDDESCSCVEIFRLICSDVFACSPWQSNVSYTLSLCKALENRTTRGGRPPETLQRHVQEPLQFSIDSVPFLAGTTTTRFGACTSAGADCDLATFGLFFFRSSTSQTSLVSSTHRGDGDTIDLIRLRDSDVLHVLSLEPSGSSTQNPPLTNAGD